MQITVKEVKVLKTGTSKQGDWELISVRSEKGTEYTTFDRKVKHMGPGSVIDIGEPEEEKGKLKFKEIVAVISEVAAPSSSDKDTSYKRDTEGIAFEYELKRQMQEVDRVSIEQQSVWKGVVETLIHGSEIKLLAEVQKDLDALTRKAIAWAESRFDLVAKPAPKPATKSKEQPAVKTGAGDKVDPLHPFAHVGEFLQWCHSQGVTRMMVLEIVGIKESDLANLDLIYAHGAVEDWLKINKPDQKTEEPELPF